MKFYLGSPGSQMHADHCNGLPVLLSFALWRPFLDDYVPSFSRVLIDSGAYSDYAGTSKVDGAKYRDWHQRWTDTAHIDAVAGLDNIEGDWRLSLRNYEAFGGFPTFHESDPPELLDELIPLARERGKWIGVGLLKPRHGKWRFIRDTLARMPKDLHVHLWAGGEYSGHPRCDSWDSTNWFRDAWQYKNALPFLTPAECVEIVVKRYQREHRRPADTATTGDLFAECV